MTNETQIQNEREEAVLELAKHAREGLHTLDVKVEETISRLRTGEIYSVHFTLQNRDHLSFFNMEKYYPEGQKLFIWPNHHNARLSINLYQPNDLDKNSSLSDINYLFWNSWRVKKRVESLDDTKTPSFGSTHYCKLLSLGTQKDKSQIDEGIKYIRAYYQLLKDKKILSHLSRQIKILRRGYQFSRFVQSLGNKAEKLGDSYSLHITDSLARRIK